MNKKGFTLIELLVSILVLGVIAGVMYRTLWQGTQSYYFGSDQADAIQKGRVSLQRMSTEIRAAYSATLATNTVDDQYAYLFFTNINNVNIEYRFYTHNVASYKAGELRKVVGANNDLLASNLRSVSWHVGGGLVEIVMVIIPEKGNDIPLRTMVQGRN